MKTKNILILLFIFLTIPFIFGAKIFASDACFTAQNVSDTYVFMDDPSATIKIRITNTSTLNRKIKFVRFTLNSNIYNFHSENEAPTGWTIKEMDNNYKPGVAMIEYSAFKTSAQLGKGQSVVFNITITGKDGETIPQDTKNIKDAFLKVRAWEPGILWFKGDEATLHGNIPSWIRFGLKCEVFASPSSLSIGKEINLVASITNVSSATQTNIRLDDISIEGDGNAEQTTKPIPAEITLAPNDTDEIQVKFKSTEKGTIQFLTFAKNANVYSPKTFSNEIYIGDFTASLTVEPDNIISGKEVTLKMSISNNSDKTFTEIKPSVPQFSGSATATLISGPDPESIDVLSPGETYSNIEWTYKIEGNPGDDYTFSAYAKCKEDLTTNTAESNTGVISVVVFSVTPKSINSGSLNQTFQFNIQNGGRANVYVTKVEIYHPSPDFIYSTANGGYNGDWAVTDNTDYITFEAQNKSQYLPGGKGMNLFITYQELPVVSSSTNFDFYAKFYGYIEVTIFGIKLKLKFKEDKKDTIVITNTTIELEYEPQNLSADGNAETTVTLTLLDGDTPMPNKPVDFQFASTDSFEENPIWIYKESTTDEQGKAKARFRAPYNSTDCTVIVKGIYCSTESSIEIPFSGYNKPNILYAGGLTPIQVNQGETVSFSVNVKNTSEIKDMDLTTDSYIIVKDDTVGGTSEFKAFLQQGTTVPAGGEITTLKFNSEKFPTSFMNGEFNPEIFCTDGNPDFDQTRTISDKLIVGSGKSSINIIDWKIKR